MAATAEDEIDRKTVWPSGDGHPNGGVPTIVESTTATVAEALCRVENPAAGAVLLGGVVSAAPDAVERCGIVWRGAVNGCYATADGSPSPMFRKGERLPAVTPPLASRSGSAIAAVVPVSGAAAIDRPASKGIPMNFIPTSRP